MRAVTAAEMRRIEEDAIAAGTTVEELMQRAGRVVADAVGEALDGRVVGRRVLVLAGPGKNGGDGLIAARILRQRGASVSVACPIPRADNDPLLEECAAAGCSITQGDLADSVATLAKAELVVDALLGTGRSRAVEGPILNALDAVRGTSGTTVVAVDVPSGLDSDTGEVDPATLPASVTVALGCVKIGCLTPHGADLCGEIHVAEINLAHYATRMSGIDRILVGTELQAPPTDEPGVGVITLDEVSRLLPQRSMTGHKGTFGHTVIVGGSAAYRGAPALAARAAARAGSGTVAIAAPETITDSIAPMAPEATHIPLPADPTSLLDSDAASHILEILESRFADALAIGPGMGRNHPTTLFMREVFDGVPISKSLLLDADALTLLPELPQWWRQFRGPIVVTPHPGEMASLCDMSVQDVQANRIELAAEKAKEWGVTVVLKGAYTVVASPDEPPSICPLALPALASGGTGDALAGIITGFLSQGLTTSAASRAGVYVHGTAAALAAHANGNMTSGLLASDLIEKIPAAMDVIRRREGPVAPLFA